MTPSAKTSQGVNGKILRGQTNFSLRGHPRLGFPHMEELITSLSPYLAECKGKRETNRVEMSLIWGISQHDQGVLLGEIACAKAGMYSPSWLIRRISDYLKSCHYF